MKTERESAVVFFFFNSVFILCLKYLMTWMITQRSKGYVLCLFTGLYQTTQWATMSHYESLWPKILILRPTMTQMSIEYNVTTQKKTKEVFHLSQFCPKNTFFGPIWPQNLKMFCFKWNLARECIWGCWLRIW